MSFESTCYMKPSFSPLICTVHPLNLHISFIVLFDIGVPITECYFLMVSYTYILFPELNCNLLEVRDCLLCFFYIWKNNEHNIQYLLCYDIFEGPVYSKFFCSCIELPLFQNQLWWPYFSECTYFFFTLAEYLNSWYFALLFVLGIFVLGCVAKLCDSILKGFIEHLLKMHNA